MGESTLRLALERPRAAWAIDIAKTPVREGKAEVPAKAAHTVVEQRE
jgi:hypothetical protein